MKRVQISRKTELIIGFVLIIISTIIKVLIRINIINSTMFENDIYNKVLTWVFLGFVIFFENKDKKGLWLFYFCFVIYLIISLMIEIL